jgi:hypothetical protein
MGQQINTNLNPASVVIARANQAVINASSIPAKAGIQMYPAETKIYIIFAPILYYCLSCLGILLKHYHSYYYSPAFSI